MKNIYL